MGRAGRPPVLTGTGYRTGGGYQVGTPTDRPEMAGHLRMMHGVWIGTTERLPELTECHNHAHDQPFGPTIAHEHRYLDEPAEDWTW